MKASDAIKGIAEILYKQAGYDGLYLQSFPKRAWENIKEESKQKWYWKAREIFNFVLKAKEGE